MRLDILMAVASEAYPDGLVWQYYKEPRKNHGDTLAKFIMLELKETYDPKASDYHQLCAACQAMGNALSEIEEVRRTFSVEAAKHESPTA